MLSTIVAKAVQLSGTAAGAIYVFDERQRLLHLRATHGMSQELIDTPHGPSSRDRGAGHKMARWLRPWPGSDRIP